MDPVARRTRGRCEADLLARHREWIEKERKEKDKKAKGKEKDKMVAIDVDDLARDDEKSQSLEIVVEGSFTGPPKNSSSDKSSTPQSKKSREKEDDVLIGESSKSADAYVSSPSIKMIETEETLSLKSPLERCRLGYHMEVLEEPIGIICKCCQLVLLGMKYIFPDLMAVSPKKRDPSNARKSMYLHQQSGFVFLWRNVVGETDLKKLEELQSLQGSGCIISHAPGTGKTCLTIVFIMTLLRAFPFPECRPVIGAPKSMLLTWQN